MAVLGELRIAIKATVTGGSITELAASAWYQLDDATNTAYTKPGSVDVSDLLTPGSKSLATFTDEVRDRVLAQA